MRSLNEADLAPHDESSRAFVKDLEVLAFLVSLEYIAAVIHFIDKHRSECLGIDADVDRLIR